MTGKWALSLFATMVLAGCQDRPSPTQMNAITASTQVEDFPSSADRRVVVFAAESVPPDFRSRVEHIGGTLQNSFDSIGVSVVSGLTDSTAALLAHDGDIRAVEPDISFQLASSDDLLSGESVDAPADAITVSASAARPQAASLYLRQWNMRAIGADRAWDAGYLGTRDVKVVILDTGIDYTHPELQGLVDLSLSRSFVPSEDTVVDRLFPGRAHFTDLLYHGTGVAATIASNAHQLAGMTQHVTLIAVKVADRAARLETSNVIAGIVYAGDVGADVVNVSGGPRFRKSVRPGLIAAYLRALNYVWRRGGLVVGVAGNDTLDLDHDGDRVSIPCQAPHTICMSATGPTVAQSVTGPWDNVDSIALYTGFGRSTIGVAAPGGQRFTNTRIWLPCTTTPSGVSPASCRTPLCPVAVRGTCLFEGIGTSWAAPHAVGLAALLVQQLGHGRPSHIAQRILQSADDLGEPGVDSYYGHGRINVARTLGLEP